MYFKDKIVWITGASSGIGEALAYAFNEQQARLILSSHEEEVLYKVKNNCSYKPEEILVLPFDLREHDQMKKKAELVLKNYEKIDILFNVGGISQRSLAVDTELTVDKRIMDINYFGTIALTKAVLPSMIKQNSGHIATISSVTGKIGVPLRSAYAASKHALFGFFDTLRAEVYKNNINITLFCPGYVRTSLSLNALTANGTAHNTMDDGMNKGMTPEFLCKKMLKALQKKKKEVYIGGKEILGIHLRRFVPGLFFKIIRNTKVT